MKYWLLLTATLLSLTACTNSGDGSPDDNGPKTSKSDEGSSYSACPKDLMMARDTVLFWINKYSNRYDNPTQYAEMTKEACIEYSSQFRDAECSLSNGEKLNNSQIQNVCSSLKAYAVKMPQALTQYLAVQKGNCIDGRQNWGLKFEVQSTDFYQQTKVQYGLYIYPEGNYRLLKVRANKVGASVQWSTTTEQGYFKAPEGQEYIDLVTHGLRLYVQSNSPPKLWAEHKYMKGSLQNLALSPDGISSAEECSPNALKYEGWL